MRVVLFSLLGNVALLGAVEPARASVLRTGVLENTFCGDACVELWKVTCKSGATNRVVARLRDNAAGAGGAIEVTALGFTGKGLAGRADHEFSAANGGFSVPAFLTRPGKAHGAMTALVVVGRVSGTRSSYDLELSCTNAFKDIETGQPTVRLVKGDNFGEGD
jgi:hypothetical protein